MKDTIEKLKQKPKDDRVAVSGGIAIGLVAILIIGWAFFFFRNISHGNAPTISAPAGANDVFDFSSLDKATQDFAKSYNDTVNQTQQIRDQAAQVQVQSQQQSQSLQGPVYPSNSGSQNPADMFGNQGQSGQ